MALLSPRVSLFAHSMTATLVALLSSVLSFVETTQVNRLESSLLAGNANKPTLVLMRISGYGLVLKVIVDYVPAVATEVSERRQVKLKTIVQFR